MVTVAQLFAAHVKAKAEIERIRKGEISSSPIDRIRILGEAIRIRGILMNCEDEIVLSREDEELVARLVSGAESPKPANQPT